MHGSPYLPISLPKHIKPVVPEISLLQVLHMSRPMPSLDPMPKVLNQPVPFQGFVNLRPPHVRLHGTLHGYNDDIDNMRHPEVTLS